ncbi:MAG: hypothetical protein AB8F34_06675 [Akkermansiaceae bacterium]
MKITSTILLGILISFSAAEAGKKKKKTTSTTTTEQTTSNGSNDNATTTEPDAVPTGQLDVNIAMVRQGIAPSLTWKIDYPTEIVDIVDIPPTDEIIPKTKLRVKISMVGVGLTDQRGVKYAAENFIKFGSSNWQTLFTGNGSEVRPNNVLVDRTVQQGETIRFAARVKLDGYSYYYNQDKNITVLRNGDTPPNVAAGYDDQSPVASYLRPYVKNGKIALGPMDMIYVSELTHTDPRHSGYDMQDSIVLVQFEKITD